MRGTWIRRAAGLAAAVLLVLPAATAWADGSIVPTQLSLDVSPDRHVAEGTVVTFSGRLKAKEQFCEEGSEITLRVYGESNGEDSAGGVVDTTTTDNQGNYEFRVRITEQARYRAWFSGKVGGVHPDIFTCQKSRSRTITMFAG